MLAPPLPAFSSSGPDGWWEKTPSDHGWCCNPERFAAHSHALLHHLEEEALTAWI
jgi:hypothetical protein